MSSPSESSLSKRVKLDLPQDQRDALIANASRHCRLLRIHHSGQIHDLEASELACTLIMFLSLFLAALESTDLGSKTAKLSQIKALLVAPDGPLDDWKRAFQKGVEEKDWIDLVALCTSPDVSGMRKDTDRRHPSLAQAIR
jgi:hypothetical protein